MWPVQIAMIVNVTVTYIEVAKVCHGSTGHECLLKTKPPIVGCSDTYRFDPYCRTALGVRQI